MVKFMEDIDEMDETDKMAIDILINAPLMSEHEMKYAVNKLKIIAKKKKNNKRKINDILDYWANKAYTISMKS
ncbi:hypothetical protein [Methanothermococcus okinawensis]|uniref:Uncharacterized protein n=1 Tax=Methanothermococcus okinawensis (strain DSM 14208 / JCM 11175 / IH1) TaxID=647113 RepID=F8AMN0_METOI|nr:hypothetical protein [Methanothermococcus okinawensis]AEH06861.1 hypothetical protein Metok_0888 [Methanothermococcus okinawensis IH1]